MSTAPRLNWEPSVDRDGNNTWSALAFRREGDARPMTYGIGQKIIKNRLRFALGETSCGLFWESEPESYRAGFATADDAKAWCQAREDAAWAKAHPEPPAPPPMTDTEILDAIDTLGLTFHKASSPGRFGCHPEKGPGYVYGNGIRDCIERIVRGRDSNPKSPPMTLDEIEAARVKHKLQITRFFGEPWNVWRDGTILPNVEAVGDDLPTVVRECVRKIEAIDSEAAEEDEEDEEEVDEGESDILPPMTADDLAQLMKEGPICVMYDPIDGRFEAWKSGLMSSATDVQGDDLSTVVRECIAKIQERQATR